MNRNSVTPPRFAILASVTLAVSLLSVPSGRAGMEDLNTGDKCQGIDCVGWNPPPATGSGGYTLPNNVTTEDCSSADSERIGRSVEWLQDHLSLIDDKMAESIYLVSWPGNSRENFKEKLDKDLKFVCINQKDKCNRLVGKVYPVFAQKRVNLCTTAINQAANGVQRDASYVGIIAHEIGHLVRLNNHTPFSYSTCEARFTNGSFSDAVGFAAEYAFRGVPYDPVSLIEDNCRPPQPEPFDWTRKPENMEPPILSEK